MEKQSKNFFGGGDGDFGTKVGLHHSIQSLIGQAGAIGLVATAVTTSLPLGLASGAFGFAILKIGQGLSRRLMLRSII